MSQSIKLSDELYNELKSLSDRECRTVPLMIQYMVQNWGVEKNKSPESSKNLQANSTDNSEEIRRLIEDRRMLVFRLRDENLSREIQKMAVENSWTDEQAEEEAIRLRADLDREVDAVNEQLKALGVL